MEYCVTVLVDSFEPDSRFAHPMPASQRQTVWGPEEIDNEENTILWLGDIKISVTSNVGSLVRLLPDRLCHLDWTRIDLYHTDFVQFQEYLKVIDDDGVQSKDATRSQPLLLLMVALLQKQNHWAVFFLRDCDAIDCEFEQTIPQLIETITLAYTDSQRVGGFLSMSVSKDET